MRFIDDIKPENITCGAEDFHKAYGLLQEANLDSASMMIGAVKREIRTIMLGIIALVDCDKELPSKEKLIELLVGRNKDVAEKVQMILNANRENNATRAGENISLAEILLRKDFGKKIQRFVEFFLNSGLDTLDKLAAVRDKEFVQIKGLGNGALDDIRRIFREYGITDNDRIFLIGKRDGERYIDILSKVIEQSR